MRQELRPWVVVVLTGLVATPLAGQGPGDSAPDFALQTLTGDSVRLANLRGHPVVVTFWGSWCPPCRYEMPLLEAAYHDHVGDSLFVLGVNGRDQELSTGAVQKFVAQFQVTFPILLDKKGKTRKRYHLRGLPTTVFVGSDGRVRGVIQGPFTADELQLNITALLSSQ